MPRDGTKGNIYVEKRRAGDKEVEKEKTEGKYFERKVGGKKKVKVAMKQKKGVE